MIGELIARVTILGYELPLSHVFGIIEALKHDTMIGMDIMEPYEITVNAKEVKISSKLSRHNRDSITLHQQLPVMLVGIREIRLTSSHAKACEVRVSESFNEIGPHRLLPQPLPQLVDGPWGWPMGFHRQPL